MLTASEIEKRRYHAIVIGSGMGGLAAGGLLAKLEHKKVLILEQHDNIGGLTHVFGRGKYTWDVGIHYVGEVGWGRLFRRLFRFVTNGEVEWKKMQSPFESFVFPDFTINQVDDPKEYQAVLIKHFPDSEKEIKRYFKDVSRGRTWCIAHRVRISARSPFTYLPLLIASLIKRGGKVGKMRTQDYMDKYIPDKKLQAVLTAQWGDYGVPPQESNFGIHSLIFKHYFYGAHFPVGGSQKISTAIEKVINARGGSIAPGQMVTKILIKGRKAYGVEVVDLYSKDQRRYQIHAPTVISNAGIRSTYSKLLDHPATNNFKAEIERFPRGASALTLYLGLKKSPASFGIHGQNFWIRESYDTDTNLQQVTKDSLEGKPKFLYLSFPSMKDPDSTVHTSEAIAIVDASFFKEWVGEHWQRRSSEYYAIKDTISRGFVAMIERHFPGFKDIIDYQELSTPLSIEHFTLREHGEMYGIKEIPERNRVPWASGKTPIKNLYISGSDVLSCGVVGAFMGGVFTAGLAAGEFGFSRILGASLAPNKKMRLTPKNPITAPTEVVKKEWINDEVVELSFRFPEPIDLIPGQHVSIQVGKDTWRYYSVPIVKDKLLTLVISIRPNGVASKFMQALKLKDTVHITAPFGKYRLERTDRDIVFLATGTGIAPFIPMVQSLAQSKHSGKVDFVFGVRTNADNYLDRYIKEYLPLIDNLNVTTCVSREQPSTPNGVSGRVTEFIKNYIKEPGSTEKDYYVCGIDYMVQDSLALLRKNGCVNTFFEGF